MNKIFEKISKGRLIALALAALVIFWGISTLNKGEKGLSDVEVHSGKITIEEGAWDELFDIYIEGSPVLIRTVEMYQYKENEVTGEYDLEFSDKHITAMREDEYIIDYDGSRITYYNPPFPTEPKSEVFYGRVAIGNDGLYLSDKLLEKFAADGYMNFEKRVEKIPVGGLADEGLSGRDSVFGLEVMDDYTYGTPGGEYWRPGDIRVTWHAVDPDSLAELYTAAGKVENGVIGDSGVVYLYDSEKTLEEIDGQYSQSNKTSGRVILIIGIIAALVCLWPLVKPYAEMLLKKLNIKLPSISADEK